MISGGQGGDGANADALVDIPVDALAISGKIHPDPTASGTDTPNNSINDWTLPSSSGYLPGSDWYSTSGTPNTSGIDIGGSGVSGSSGVSGTNWTDYTVGDIIEYPAQSCTFYIATTSFRSYWDAPIMPPSAEWKLILPWDANLIYATDDLVSFECIVYIGLLPNNIGHEPDLSLPDSQAVSGGPGGWWDTVPSSIPKQTFELYKSRVYLNVGFEPSSNPTKWLYVGSTSLTTTPSWSPTTVYQLADVVRYSMNSGFDPGAGAISGASGTAPTASTGTDNVRVTGTISTDPSAEPFQFSDPNMSLDDLYYIYAQAKIASGLWQHEQQFNGHDVPWLRRGSIIQFTGLKDEHGATMTIAPGLLQLMTLVYDPTQSVSRQMRALAWTSNGVG